MGVMQFFIEDLALFNLMFALFGIVTCLVADVAILYVILSQEKRAVIEAQLEESRQEAELQEAYIRQVEKKGEELAKIRYDLNNQLMAIIQLARTGEKGTAKQMIDALTGELNRKIE